MDDRDLSWTRRLLDEIGVSVLLAVSSDIKLLLIQRFIRLLAYGSSTLVLATFLTGTGASPALVGIFMTLTLVGDMVISFLLALIADGLGRRKVLAFGAISMTVSGMVFAVSSNFWILLFAAIVGVITPSGNEIGPFRAVEESIISHLTSEGDRARVFAWYTLLGSAGVATGLLAAGYITTSLTKSYGLGPDYGHRIVFGIYAVVGVVKFVLCVMMSKDCEAESKIEEATELERAHLADELHEEHDSNVKPQKPSTARLFARLSRESQSVVVRLCLLFAFDNFASGLAPMSWMTFYFKSKFNIDEGQLGTIFSVASIVSTISILVAASIAKRLGNVKTMVFTHLPSSICLALIGLPQSLPPAAGLLLLRASTQSMDAAPRSAFLSTVVLPEERTVVIGIVNVVKTASQSLGPYLTGLLASRQMFWIAFMLAGMLKASYDLGILVAFANHKPRQSR